MNPTESTALREALKIEAKAAAAIDIPLRKPGEVPLGEKFWTWNHLEGYKKGYITKGEKDSAEFLRLHIKVASQDEQIKSLMKAGEKDSSIIADLKEENERLREMMEKLAESVRHSIWTIETLEKDLKQYHPGSYNGSGHQHATMKEYQAFAALTSPSLANQGG